MKPTAIPDSFLELARIEGVDIDLAVDLYHRKIKKKTIADLAYRLARIEKSGEDPNAKEEAEAKRRLRRLWTNYQRLNADRSIMHADGVVNGVEGMERPSTYTTRSYGSYIERAAYELEKLVGGLKYTNAVDETVPLNGWKAVAGDIHGIFKDDRAFARLLNDPADELVLMGDISDMYAASRHRQTIDHVTVREELAHDRAMMEQIAKKFKRVRVIKGNHDERPMRRIQEMFPQLLPLIVHPVDMLCAGLKNIKIISHDIVGTAPAVQLAEDINMNFMGQIGDAVFGHFEGFYGADAPRKLDRWLGEWGHVLQLPVEPRICFQAHTHRLSMEMTPRGRMVVGTGCLCKPMAYQIEGHNKYQPPTHGYVRIWQDKTGRTDLGRTQLVPIVH